MLRKILLYILINKVLVSALILLLSVNIVFAEAQSNHQQKSQFQLAIEKIYSLSTDSLSLNSIPFCRQYTCQEIINIAIPKMEWLQATQLLNEKPRSASLERALLTEVFSRMEVILGRIARTQYDIGGTFRVDKMPQVNSIQLDCVDEAFNMYVFFNLLNNEGRLYWHEVGNIVHRGWLFDMNYPHTALTVIDKNTREQFVIDSWFHDNGRPPELLSLQRWKSGWTPADFR